MDKMTGDNVLKSLFHLNRYVSGTKTDRHNHAYAELLYVSDGSLTQHISGDDVHMHDLLLAGLFSLFNRPSFSILSNVLDIVVTSIRQASASSF